MVKNKMAAPFRIAEFQVMFNQGINRIGELIDMGVKENIVEKTGSWLAFGGNRIGQGRDNAIQFLRDNPDVYAEIEELLNQRIYNNVVALPAAAESEEEAGDSGEEEVGVA